MPRPPTPLRTPALEPPRLVRRGQGLGARLAVLASVLLFASMVAGSTLLLQAMAHTYREEARQRAAALLGTLSVPCAMALSINALERLDDYLAEVAQAGSEHMGLQYVAMCDRTGVVIADAAGEAGRRQGLAARQRPIGEEFLAQATESGQALWFERRGEGDKGPQLFVSMPAVSGLRWGTLVAVFDLRPVEERVAFARRLLVVVGAAFALVLAVTLYLGLSRIVVFPVRKLAAAASAIQGGNLAARADVAQDDELGRLADVFNAMAGEIETNTQDLEQKVADRSAELQRKNEELTGLNQRLQVAVAELDRLAHMDALTNVHNRRHFVDALESAVRDNGVGPARAPEPPGPHDSGTVTLLMIDVDHFKRFNDRYGHLAGDAVLRDVARLLGTHLRQSDVLARYGGEEFAAILPGTARGKALEVADRLRQSVAAHVFLGPNGEDWGGVTISIGAASHPDDAQTPRDLIERADQALYAAKTGGRNLVVSYPEVQTA